MYGVDIHSRQNEAMVYVVLIFDHISVFGNLEAATYPKDGRKSALTEERLVSNTFLFLRQRSFLVLFSHFQRDIIHVSKKPVNPSGRKPPRRFLCISWGTPSRGPASQTAKRSRIHIYTVEAAGEHHATLFAAAARGQKRKAQGPAYKFAHFDLADVLETPGRFRAGKLVPLAVLGAVVPRAEGAEDPEGAVVVDLLRRCVVAVYLHWAEVFGKGRAEEWAYGFATVADFYNRLGGDFSAVGGGENQLEYLNAEFWMKIE